MLGVKQIGGLFDPWVKKNCVIGEELSKTFKCFREFKTLGSGLGTFAQDIFAYDAEGDIYWALDEQGSLLPTIRRVCTLKADLSGLQKFLKAQKTSDGRDVWKAFYTVNVFFGGTALKAKMTWYEGVSISRFLPQITDTWSYVAGNPARKPCQRYSKLGLLDHVCFPSYEDEKLDSMNAFHSASVRSTARYNRLCKAAYS